MIHTRWYDEVKEITERLVRINSISPSVAGENACAAEIAQALAERGLTPGYWKADRDERRNIWTMLEGSAVPPAANRGFYPYVSDISFMRVDEAVYESLPTLAKNFPLWRDRGEEIDERLRDEYFIIPFDLIHELDCDVANIGPWGKEAHGKGERVHMPYSFETVPELIHNVIVRVLRDAASQA